MFGSATSAADASPEKKLLLKSPFTPWCVTSQFWASTCPAVVKLVDSISISVSVKIKFLAFNLIVNIPGLFFLFRIKK